MLSPRLVVALLKATKRATTHPAFWGRAFFIFLCCDVSLFQKECNMHYHRDDEKDDEARTKNVKTEDGPDFLCLFFLRANKKRDDEAPEEEQMEDEHDFETRQKSQTSYKCGKDLVNHMGVIFVSRNAQTKTSREEAFFVSA